MTNIAKILSPENIVLDIEVSSKKRAFEQAGITFENNIGIARSVISENLFARERLGSTGLGHGIAIPHGRIKDLKSPQALFMRLANPIPFESPDGKPVSILIFLLIPDTVTQQHLDILAELAELMSDPDMREDLASETDESAIYSRLVTWTPAARDAIPPFMNAQTRPDTSASL